MKKVLAIIGPTATGKTDIALEVADKFNGEIICCDSRQVYKGLDIGTGKLPGSNVKYQKEDGFWIVDGITIWFYDLLSPDEQLTAKKFQDIGREKIEEISQKGKLPIVVGGTGFYLQALLEDLNYFSVPDNPNIRNQVGELSVEELQERVSTLSPTFWERMNASDRQNPRRLIRVLELIPMNPYITTGRKAEPYKPLYDVLKIGLSAPRPTLNQRIDIRVDRRVESGMFEEAEELHKNGLSLKRMDELGLEYRYLAKFLKGELTKQQSIEILKTKIHQFAKRQMTWFKRDKDIKWFDITDPEYQGKVVNSISSWYH